MNLFTRACRKKHVREGVNKRKAGEDESLTSSEETIDTWASRETSASLAFFARFWFRALVCEIFFTEALVILGATCSSAGSSGAIGEAAAACVDGSSSSLRDKSKLWKQDKEN
jgi:hypothetical protein